MAAETQITIVLALQDNPGSIDDAINPENVTSSLIDIIRRIKQGTLLGKLLYYIDKADGTAASRTVAFTQVNATEGDTVTICGIVFTAMVATAPSTNAELGQFAAITSDTVCGANFATAFNAHPRTKGLGTAVNAAGTVTITMTNKGVHGNLGTLATSDATFVTLGGATFTSGAAGTIQQQLTVDLNSKTLA